MRSPSRPLRTVSIDLVMAVLIVGIACWSVWLHHTWFAWLVPVGVETPVALFWAVGSSYLVEVRRRTEIRRAFSLYLSPHMADQIADARFDLKPGGQIVEATMMFTDLQGFTKLTEQIHDPRQIADVLNTYFNNTPSMCWIIVARSSNTSETLSSRPGVRRCRIKITLTMLYWQLGECISSAN